MFSQVHLYLFVKNILLISILVVKNNVNRTDDNDNKQNENLPMEVEVSEKFQSALDNEQLDALILQFAFYGLKSSKNQSPKKTGIDAKRVDFGFPLGPQRARKARFLVQNLHKIA